MTSFNIQELITDSNIKQLEEIVENGLSTFTDNVKALTTVQNLISEALIAYHSGEQLSGLRPDPNELHSTEVVENHTIH